VQFRVAPIPLSCATRTGIAAVFAAPVEDLSPLSLEGRGRIRQAGSPRALIASGVTPEGTLIWDGAASGAPGGVPRTCHDARFSHARP